MRDHVQFQRVRSRHHPWHRVSVTDRDHITGLLTHPHDGLRLATRRDGHSTRDHDRDPGNGSKRPHIAQTYHNRAWFPHKPHGRYAAL